MAIRSLIDGNVRDQNEATVIGAMIYVYDRTGDLAELSDASGEVIDNPVLSGEDGYYAFHVEEEGYYTLKIWYEGRLRYIDANRIAGREPVAIVLDLVDEAERLANALNIVAGGYINIDSALPPLGVADGEGYYYAVRSAPDRPRRVFAAINSGGVPDVIFELSTSATVDGVLRDFKDVLSNPATGSSAVSFSATAQYDPGTLGKRLQQVLTPQDHPFLAVGDGVADDTAALTAWINALNDLTDSTPGPVGGFLPLGRYRYTSQLPAIRESITIFSDNARQGVLVPQGAFDALLFKGIGSRVPDCGLINVRIDAGGMTGGYALVVDWTQDFTARSILINDGWNGIYCRQSGGASFHGVLNKLRGEYGFHALGYGGTKGGVNQPLRNGQVDKIDVLALHMTIEGVYQPGQSDTPLDACVIDGLVHTIIFEELRLLSCRSGFSAVNTATLDQKFAPSLMRGLMEAENTLYEGIRLSACNDVVLSSAFASSSGLRSGIRLAAGAKGVTLHSPTSRSNVGHGILIENGATGIAIHDPLVVLNDPAAAGIKDETTDGVFIHGGRCGGGSDGMAETQANGVNGTAATRVYATDLRGNAGNATNGLPFTRDCPGAAPNPTTTPVIGASPWSYSAGGTTESIAINGGTVSLVSVNGIPWAVTTNQILTVPANSVVTITYSDAPTVRVTRV